MDRKLFGNRNKICLYQRWIPLSILFYIVIVRDKRETQSSKIDNRVQVRGDVIGDNNCEFISPSIGTQSIQEVSGNWSKCWKPVWFLSLELRFILYRLKYFICILKVNCKTLMMVVLCLFRYLRVAIVMEKSRKC